MKNKIFKIIIMIISTFSRSSYASVRNYTKYRPEVLREKWDKQFHQLKLIEKFLKENTQLKVVVMIGRQGVGKSTFVNFMRGENFDKDLKPLGDNCAVCSNDSIDSCTKLVTLYKGLENDNIIYADLPGFNDKSDLGGSREDALCAKLGVNEFLKILSPDRIQAVVCMTQFFQLQNRADGLGIRPILDFVYRVAKKSNNENNIDLSPFTFIFTHKKSSWDNLTKLTNTLKSYSKSMKKKSNESENPSIYVEQNIVLENLLLIQSNSVNSWYGFLSKTKIFSLGSDDLIKRNNKLRRSIYDRIKECEQCEIQIPNLYDFSDIYKLSDRSNESYALGNFLSSFVESQRLCLEIFLDKSSIEEKINRLKNNKIFLNTGEKVHYQNVEGNTAPFGCKWKTTLKYSGPPFLDYECGCNFSTRNYEFKVEYASKSEGFCSIGFIPGRLSDKGKAWVKIYVEKRVKNKQVIESIDKEINLHKTFLKRNKLKDFESEKMKDIIKNNSIIATIDSLYEKVKLNSPEQKNSIKIGIMKYKELYKSFVKDYKNVTGKNKLFLEYHDDNLKIYTKKENIIKELSETKHFNFGLPVIIIVAILIVFCGVGMKNMFAMRS